MDEVLKIENLRINFEAFGGQVQAVRGVSLCVKKGEILALVGESGCGKSVTAQAVLGLNPSPPSHILEGCILLSGKEVTQYTQKEWENVRGQEVGMIFQDPISALNPTMKIGQQITETLFRRGRMTKAECKKEAVRLLELVQIPEASLRAEQYPHQFSGGMRQRAMIAMALAWGPKLMIADEPTTALDVTIQLEILRLLIEIREKTDTAILFITHDLRVVANLADRVAVMYGGKIVEEAMTADLFQSPLHPYTAGLMQSVAPTTGKGERFAIGGTPPDLYDPPKGCAFAPRCRQCMAICLKEEPPVFEKNGRSCACWRVHPQFPEKEVDRWKNC